MLKVVELFAGVGTQRMALKRLGVQHDVVAISEIDPYAINSYKAIHGETLNLGDISHIDPQDVVICSLIAILVRIFQLLVVKKDLLKVLAQLLVCCGIVEILLKLRSLNTYSWRMLRIWWVRNSCLIS